MLITPASQEVYLEALQERLIEVFVKAGAYVCNPTCGRMGGPKAKIYLASAINGEITDPRGLEA